MATTLDNINLPSNPDLGAAEVGKDFLLFVNTGTVSTPEWQMIGGQRNSGLTRQAETIDVSHKTSGGWSATKAGLRSWSIDCPLCSPCSKVMQGYGANSSGVSLLRPARGWSLAIYTAAGTRISSVNSRSSLPNIRRRYRSLSSFRASTPISLRSWLTSVSTS